MIGMLARSVLSRKTIVPIILDKNVFETKQVLASLVRPQGSPWCPGGRDTGHTAARCFMYCFITFLDCKCMSFFLKSSHSFFAIKFCLLLLLRRYNLLKYKINCACGRIKLKTKKAVNTGVSQAVPHLSTNPALSRLTSEFGWVLVHLE